MNGPDTDVLPNVSLAVPGDPLALTPSNPGVIQIGSKLRWRPATVIRRIERALPGRFEQSMYLLVARDFGIQPETMSALLSAYHGRVSLIERDMLRPRSIGQGLQTDAFQDFADFFFACMNLLKVVTQEYNAFAMRLEQAAQLVAVYGDRDAEALVEIIDGNLDRCCDILAISNSLSASLRMRLCLHVFISEVLPENRECGLPDMLDVDDFAEICLRRRSALHNVIGRSLDRDEALILEAEYLIHGTEVEKRPLEESIDDLVRSFPAAAHDSGDFKTRWWERYEAESADRDWAEQSDPRPAPDQPAVACGGPEPEPAIGRCAA